MAYKFETDPKPESASLEQSMSGEFSIRFRTTHLHNALTVQKHLQKSLVSEGHEEAHVGDNELLRHEEVHLASRTGRQAGPLRGRACVRT